MSEKRRRRRHSPERTVRKVHDVDTMLNAGKDPATVPRSLEVSEATPHRWRARYGSMKAEERAPGRSRGRRLKELEDKNQRLKRLLTDQAFDIQMLKHVAAGSW